MERFPTELIYLLIFLGIIVFNFLRQQAARRRQEEQAQAPPEPPPAAEEPLEDVWGRLPAPAPAAAPVLAVRPAPPALPAAPPHQRRPHPVRAALKDKRDLRRAVILMMVLGPCRAQEPPR